jgi:hypothetical protein
MHREATAIARALPAPAPGFGPAPSSPSGIEVSPREKGNKKAPGGYRDAHGRPAEDDVFNLSSRSPPATTRPPSPGRWDRFALVDAGGGGKGPCLVDSAVTAYPQPGVPGPQANGVDHSKPRLLLQPPPLPLTLAPLPSSPGFRVAARVDDEPHDAAAKHPESAGDRAHAVAGAQSGPGLMGPSRAPGRGPSLSRVSRPLADVGREAALWGGTAEGNVVGRSTASPVAQDASGSNGCKPNPVPPADPGEGSGCAVEMAAAEATPAEPARRRPIRGLPRPLIGEGRQGHAELPAAPPPC